MEWYESPVLGNTVAKKYSKIRRKITRKKIHPSVYLLVVSKTGKYPLEIIPSPVLLQKNYPDDDLLVIGMAGTNTEKKELIQAVLTQVYEARGDFNVREYLGISSDGDS